MSADFTMVRLFSDRLFAWCHYMSQPSGMPKRLLFVTLVYFNSYQSLFKDKIMQKINYIFTVILLVSASLAQAQTTTLPAKVPGDQGIASVNKNLEKNPDNKGLQTASEQLKKNRVKHQEQMEKRKEDKAEHSGGNSEHHGAMNRSARPGRPGK